jgi:hypothetical protein
VTVLVHELVPPRASPVQGKPAAQERVLDTAPTESRAPGPHGPVQDVLLQLPGEEDDSESFPTITVTFDMDDPALDAVVDQVADLAFVMSGPRGLATFEAALKGARTRAVPGFLGALGPDRPVPVRGEDRYLDDRRTPQRGRLLASFARHEEQIRGRRTDAELAVQQSAVTLALARLEASRRETLVEARRYLSLAAVSSAADVLAGDGPNRLTGPETLGLVADLIAIGNARARLAGLVSVQRLAQRESDRTNLGMLYDDRARAGIDQPYLSEDQLRQLSRDLAALPDSAPLADAKQKVAGAREALATVVAERAAARPLLYRLWDTDIPFQALRLLRASRQGNVVADRATVGDSTTLRSAVLGRLRTTYQAATSLTRRLDGEPELVWAFEPLIDAALLDLDVDVSEFAARAARERIRAEHPGADLAVWSEWLGYAQIAFTITGAEPLAAGATVAQAVVDLGSAVVKAFAVARQQIGEDAFLRPSARLGVPPSYFGPLMDVLDVAINAAGLPVDTKPFRAQ